MATARCTRNRAELTQKDIDGAVMHTLETKTLPSQAARAYEAIRGSVVRVREFEREPTATSDDTDAASAPAW